MDYIQTTAKDTAKMLEAVGASDLDALFDHIPESIRFRGDLDIPAGQSEVEFIQHASELASKNISAYTSPSFLGAGMYSHFVPSVVEQLASRNEFYTAYTPYQAEASQGMLQAFFEYQTLICELTGMDVSNASHYDAATGMAEAVLMACNETDRSVVLISSGVHPEFRETLQTFVRHIGIEVREAELENGTTVANPADDVAAVIFQAPNFLGNLEDGPALTKTAHDVGAFSIVIADPISLGLLQPPGAYGADIVVGDVQPFGVDIGFGGPSCGFMACRDEYVKNIPGRVVGETVDHDGRRGYVLTLQTREQHIRREKASSNICTNQGLMALRATIHMAALGKVGLERVANLNLQKAHYLADRICSIDGFSRAFDVPFFREFAVSAPMAPSELNNKLIERDLVGGFDLTASYPNISNGWLLTTTETNRKEDIDRFVDAVAEITG